MTALVRWRRSRDVAGPGLHDLLGRAGGPQSTATAVNGSGTVVGTASGRAFAWSCGTVQDLGPSGGGSTATAVDDAGVVVGCSWTAEQRPAATVWQAGATTRLQGLTGDGATTATGIGGGVVVGHARVLDTAGSRALAWSDQRPIDLGHLGGGSAQALAVNRVGVVVGWSTTRSGRGHAALWSGGEIIDLDAGGARSAALAVNDRGQVAGWRTTEDGRTCACLWTDGEVVEVCAWGGSRSYALGVNAEGVVVGWGLPADGRDGVGFVHGDGRLHALGTLGGRFSRANAVSDTGLVVGQSSTGAGAFGFRLTAGGWSWDWHAFACRLP